MTMQSQMSAIDNLKDFSSALASDLAAGLYPAIEIFARHGLEPDEGARLLSNERFQEILKAAKTEWASVGNTKERIRVKARIALEEGIVDMFQLLQDPKIPAAARVAAFKELKEIGGVIPKEQESATGFSAASISIHLGADGGATVAVSHGVTQQPVEDATVIEAEDWSIETDVGLPAPPEAEIPMELEDAFTFDFGDTE